MIGDGGLSGARGRSLLSSFFPLCIATACLIKEGRCGRNGACKVGDEDCVNLAGCAGGTSSPAWVDGLLYFLLPFDAHLLVDPR